MNCGKIHKLIKYRMLGLNMNVMQHNLLHVLQYFVPDEVATKWYQERSANGKQWCGLSEMM
jgi:hypothetical protein